MRRIITYLASASRWARLAWGAEVQRWTLLLVLVTLPVFIATGTLAAWSGAENARLVCTLCAAGCLLSCLPMAMQAKDVED